MSHTIAVSESVRPVPVAEPSPRYHANSEWRQALGPLWQLQLALFAVLLFVAGASLPLADPDLPIHVATGEWIVAHRAVPFVEPFAWTRAGEPFQAYSWAIEALYYVILQRFGPLGLQALHGLVFTLLAGVMLVLGRVARWNPWATLAMVAANVMVALSVSPYLRPQSVLLIALPLAWALVRRSITTDRLGWTLAGLTILSATVANTHLLFLLVGAPCVLLLATPPRDLKRIALVPGAIALGWLLTPYAFHWPEIFRLNFAPNALFGPPTPINEYKPGFLAIMGDAGSSLVLVLAFTLLPWAAATRLTSRERVLHGLLWVAGLVMFALAVRSLVVWWLLIIPMAGMLLQGLKTPALPVVLVAQRAIVHGIFFLVAAQALETWQDPALRAGDTAMRYLPSTNARTIEPLARWLECSTRRDVGGRLVTIFNYGGYVPWRLPHLSESIDGRTIFPDSVARAETYFMPVRREIPLQPWRTADLAILPLSFPVAAVLDTASGWHRIAVTSQLDGPARMVGLWVTDDWWGRAGRAPFPERVVPVMHTREPRHATCEDIVPRR
jgi:hypothetical protein